MNRFLIVRTDRLGDVLLTTPAARALKRRFPESHVAWLVRPYTAPLLEKNPDVDQVLLDRAQPARRLSEELRQNHFDAAIVAYPRWRTAWALWRAGIPERIGPASKPYSFFFNRRLWQHRSKGLRHEADYNLELLSPLGVAFERFPTRLALADDEKARARKFLESMRINFQKPLVALHPGSGGSAPRWPLASFIELGDRLQEAGMAVVVTGGPGEDYQYLMIDQMRRIPVFVAAGSVGVRELAAIFSQANLVVSNSTGPLHLAVAAGVPTVSVYSSTAACHPRRWGPYPAYVLGEPAHAVALAPSGETPEADLAAVTVETVMDLCLARLGKKGSLREPAL